MLCIPAVLPVKTWENIHKKKKISDFVTATDEAFAMLLFENNIEIFLKMAETGTKTLKELKTIDEHKDIQTKYTRDMGREVGWNDDGMERFEILIKETRDNRVKTDVNKATYVDMDQRFYKDIQSTNMGELPEIVLNTPTVKKKKGDLPIVIISFLLTVTTNLL